MARPTVAIIGANLAGGRAAETLRAEGFDGRILLIGEEAYRPYERPPLSKELLRGEWDVEKTFLRAQDWYAANDVDMILGARASMLDLAERIVMAGGVLYEWDRLILCTGGTPRVLPIPGMELPGVHTLRTIDDAQAIGEAARAGARIAVIGAGFIGCEVAASARKLGCDVHLVDVLPVPMVRALGEEIGGIYGDIHRDHGVVTHFGSGIDRVEGAGRAERVVLSDGASIECDLVVVGVGIQPNDDLAHEAGMHCDNGIVVNERCETSAPGVYAAGDVANHPNPILGHRVRLEHWQNAQNQAAAAARNLLGRDAPFSEVPWFWSDQYDVNLQMFGHPVGYDRIVYRGSIPDRSFAAYFMAGARMTAALGVNRAKDVRATRAFIEHAAPIEDAVLADEGTDLRALAKTVGA